MFIKVKMPWSVMIPAEDMHKGLMLQRAILIHLLNAFSLKKSTKDLGYFTAVTSLEDIGEGKIREHTGEITFPVVFSGITFKLFRGEIVRGVVHRIFKSGVLMKCGPFENIYLSNMKMTGYTYISGENPSFMNENMSRIEIDSTVRFVVLATEWKEAEREFIALASIDGDYLGPV